MKAFWPPVVLSENLESVRFHVFGSVFQFSCPCPYVWVVAVLCKGRSSVGVPSTFHASTGDVHLKPWREQFAAHLACRCIDGEFISVVIEKDHPSRIRRVGGCGVCQTVAHYVRVEVSRNEIYCVVVHALGVDYLHFAVNKFSRELELIVREFVELLQSTGHGAAGDPQIVVSLRLDGCLRH